MKSSKPLAEVRTREFDLDLPEEEVALLEGLLSADERARAARYVVPRVRSRFTVGRARLRWALGESLGVEPGSIAFTYGIRGKPALAPPWNAAGLRFSLSHSAGRGLLALTDGLEVGCDIEAIRSIRHGDPVARRVFSPAENRYLNRFQGEARRAAFFRIWTLKEAFVKALGDGFAFPTRSFTVTVGDGEAARLTGVEGDRDAPARWHIASIDAAEGFVAAVCVACGSRSG